VSTLDVIAEILREAAPRALRARQIAELAGSRLPTASQTPQTVVARDLAIDIRDHGDGSRFLRVARGEYVLKHASPIAFVDERPIRDLQPVDVAGYRQCHFGGPGIWAQALEDGGWPGEWPVWTAVCRSLTEDFWSEWLRLVWACRPARLFGELDDRDCFSDVCSQLADGYVVTVLQPHVCFTASRGRGQLAAAAQPPGEAAHGHWYSEQLELPGTRPTSSRRQGGAVTLPQATIFVTRAIESLTWTGPRADEAAPSGMLLGRVPGDRWPHGPPSAHEARCNLHPHRGSSGGLFCDCALSEASP
jgi:HB1, ASXL, restriction endonuclease HTH domain